MNGSASIASTLPHAARAGCAALLATLLAGCAYVPGTPSPIDQYRERLAEQKSIERAAELAALEDPAKRKKYTVEEKLATGDNLRDTGKLQRAVVEYYQAHRLDPEDPRAMERIGFIQLTAKPEVAHLTFSELVEAHPDSATAHRGLGLALLAENRPVEAREALERSNELEADSPVTCYALSVALELLGERDAAFAFAQRAFELSPVDARIAANLGVLHMLRGEYAQAEKLLRRATLIAPNNEAHHNNLGLTLGMMQRYDEALAEFRAVGNEQRSRNNLGYVYFLNGEYDRAVEEYTNALLADGDDDQRILANLNRALDLRKHGETKPTREEPTSWRGGAAARPAAFVAEQDARAVASALRENDTAEESSP